MGATHNSVGTILLVEDHQDIAEMLFAYFEQRDYILDYAPNGEVGISLATENRYDVVILDLMLPRLDGLTVCRRLRNEARKSTPVLMLTARDTLEDKITGLDAGADDYLVKPFEIRELEARVHALIRRNRGRNGIGIEVLTIGDLTFDANTLIVQRAGRTLSPSPIGLQLLKILMTASPSVVGRREIEQEIWGDLVPDSDTLRSHMYNLRKVIDRPFSKQMLHTIQSVGYRLYDPDG